MLERMESMAGRIVANELMAVADTDGYGALDELGRERLRKICQEFHQTCRKVNREQEIENLHWRVQAIACGEDYGTEQFDVNAPEQDPNTCLADDTSPLADTIPKRPAQLRVPTTRRACSWWRPDFWSIARPTDFCYGDCVWGFLGLQPKSLTITEWINMLWRREEMEYDIENGENYKAAPINRFRCSWYDLHLLTSFGRVTETTSSVHTFMKTPGAYGYASKCAQVSPNMIEDAILRQEQKAKGKTCRVS